MMSTCRTLALILAAMAMSGRPDGVLADGFFGQVDLGQETVGAVLAYQRDRLTMGLNATSYDGGRELTASLLYTLPATPFAQVKLGPTLGFEWPDDERRKTRAGIRLTADKYSAASFGSTFLLADLSSVNRSWFVLAQVNVEAISSGFELSRGGSETYHETTFAYRKDIPGSDWAIRAGYKFDSDEAFVGMSINTF